MNKAILVLVLMIFCHLLADYTLQGWLAQAKAKSYWEKTNTKYDYIPALICHSTMWSIMIFLPIIYFNGFELGWLWLFLPINIAIHCFIDDSKANKHKINLCQDQILHLIQILCTHSIWLAFSGGC